MAALGSKEGRGKGKKKETKRNATIDGYMASSKKRKTESVLGYDERRGHTLVYMIVFNIHGIPHCA